MDQFLHGSHHDGEAMLLHVNRGSFVILRDEGEDDVKPFSENEIGPTLLNLQRTILNNNDFTNYLGKNSSDAKSLPEV